MVEFIIVFGSFCCFFYFVLSTKLRNFYDIIHTVENTIAMSIGKFNFGSLRAASEMAAWIFFVFSSKFCHLITLSIKHNFYPSSIYLLKQTCTKVNNTVAHW